MSSHESLMPVGIVPLEPVRRLGNIASVLIAASCVANVYNTWAMWNIHAVFGDYVSGESGVGDAELIGADDTTITAGWFSVVFSLLAGLFVVGWLWRVRLNVEQLDPDGQRLGRGWVIGGWVVPIVWFWFPYRIVKDVWRTSSPADVEAPHTPVKLWWFAWVASFLASGWQRFNREDYVTLEQLQLMAGGRTAITFFECVAGVFLVLIVRRISAWQSIPRPVAHQE